MRAASAACLALLFAGVAAADPVDIGNFIKLRKEVRTKITEVYAVARKPDSTPEEKKAFREIQILAVRDFDKKYPQGTLIQGKAMIVSVREFKKDNFTGEITYHVRMTSGDVLPPNAKDDEISCQTTDKTLAARKPGDVVLVRGKLVGIGNTNITKPDGSRNDDGLAIDLKDVVEVPR